MHKPPFERNGLPVGMNAAAHRLPIGTVLPRPVGKVSEEMLVEVCEILNQLTRHPDRCIGLKQMKTCAEKQIALNAILDRRMNILRMYVNGFVDQANTLDPEEPAARIVKSMCAELVKVLDGEI